MNIQSKLEEISEALVLSEPSDFQSVSMLYNRINEFNEGVKETGEKKAGAVLKAVLHIIEGILLEEVEDPNAAFSIVNDTVVALQSVY